MTPVRNYQILEHRADLKIKVFGSDKEELFRNALSGMTSGLRPKIRNKKSKIKKIKIKSFDLPALLIDFLSEALYLGQTNKEVYTDVKFIKFTDTEIEAELLGCEAERFGEDIKAVTYHDLDIRQKKDKTWESTILFDV